MAITLNNLPSALKLMQLPHAVSNLPQNHHILSIERFQSPSVSGGKDWIGVNITSPHKQYWLICWGASTNRKQTKGTQFMGFEYEQQKAKKLSEGYNLSTTYVDDGKQPVSTQLPGFQASPKRDKATKPAPSLVSESGLVWDF